jgi:hypothetical protein
MQDTEFHVKMAVDLPSNGRKPVREGQVFQAYVDATDGLIRIKTDDGPRLVFRGEIQRI